MVSVPFTPAAHDRPGSPVRASGTYVMAPYGRMLCAMLGELAVPTCERPDASQPGPLPFSWDRAAQVAMETGGLWLLHGSEKKGIGKEDDDGEVGMELEWEVGGVTID